MRCFVKVRIFEFFSSPEINRNEAPRPSLEEAASPWNNVAARQPACLGLALRPNLVVNLPTQPADGLFSPLLCACVLLLLMLLLLLLLFVVVCRS